MADRKRWFEAFRRSPATDLAEPMSAPIAASPTATVGQILAKGATRPTPVGPTISESEAEQGVAGTAIFGGTISGEEYNQELQGQKGMETYDKMRRSDAQVRASLQAIKLPLLSAVWEAQPPEDGDTVDQAIADFVHSTLFDDDAMTDSWSFVLRHILLELDFGFSATEKIWRVDDLGYYRLRRLAPRLPRTFRFWHLKRDGTLVRAWQWAPEIAEDVRNIPQRPSADPTTFPSSQPMPPSVRYRYIPIEGKDLVVFTLDREGDNVEGISMLRSAYKHFWYKDLIYHLDGVRLDRYGIGIPTAELTAEHALSETELDDLEVVLKDLRANERVFLIAPPGVRYRILGPEAGGGATSNAGPIIEHHNTMIARNILAGFLTMGTDPHGTLGFGSRLADLFVSSLYGIVSGINSDLKKAVVKPLCDLNFNMTNRQYPSIKVRDLESTDIERLVTVLAQAASSTMLTPDDGLESSIRKSLRIPPLPEELTRKAKKDEADAAAAAGALMPGQVDPNAPPGQQGVAGQDPNAPTAPDIPSPSDAGLPSAPKPMLNDLIDAMRLSERRDPVTVHVHGNGPAPAEPVSLGVKVERNDAEQIIKKTETFDLGGQKRRVVVTDYERDTRGLIIEERREVSETDITEAAC